MCTPPQTIRRNYACSIDETEYMKARLAGKYEIVYKDEMPVNSTPETVGSLNLPDGISELAETVDSRSLSVQHEFQALSHRLKTGIYKRSFSFSTNKLNKSIYLVYPLLMAVSKCRGSPGP